jgi:hypothetical protein
MGGYDLHPTSRNQARTFRHFSFPTYTQKAPCVANRAHSDPNLRRSSRNPGSAHTARIEDDQPPQTVCHPRKQPVRRSALPVLGGAGARPSGPLPVTSTDSHELHRRADTSFEGDVEGDDAQTALPRCEGGNQGALGSLGGSSDSSRPQRPDQDGPTTGSMSASAATRQTQRERTSAITRKGAARAREPPPSTDPRFSPPVWSPPGPPPRGLRSAAPRSRPGPGSAP